MFTKSLLTIALVTTSQAASAQQAIPNAGVQLQQIPPAPVREKAAPDLAVEHRAAPANSDPAGARIRVNALHVTGQTLYTEAELIAATGFVPGREMSLGELRNAAAKIAGHYNARGYFLAQAYLPAQNIVGGSVTISVVEGRYGNIDVRDRSTLSAAHVGRLLSGLGSGTVVADAPLERRLLLLSDVPGVRVKSTLSPGAAVGTSDLVVDISPAARVSGSVEVDNAGNRYTGAYRLGGSINLNNPTGIGDVLTLRLLGSTGGLGYGRLAYQAPVGNATLGIAYTHLRYVLGREFKSLAADGKADIFSAFASYPLVRSRDANLYATASADVQLLRDNIGLVSAQSRRNVGTLTLGFSGDSRDESGRNSFSGGWTHGNLSFRDPLERAADTIAGQSEGGFNKFQASVARLQTVNGALSLYAAVRGQVALDNLDSSEKIELGGAYGVRAYPEGEAYGDSGYIATVEVRLGLNRFTQALPGQFQLIGFVDAGEVRYAQHPWFTGSNHAQRSGIGAGLDWAGPAGISARVNYATRLGNEPVTSGPDKPGRAWFQLSKLF